MTSFIPARFALIPVRLRHVPMTSSLRRSAATQSPDPFRRIGEAVRSGHRYQRLPGNNQR